MKPNKKFNLLKTLFNGLGAVTTLAFALFACAPDTMKVPNTMRPWFLLAFIVWFVLYATGMFKL
ncbi:MAG: hypothetical protein HPY59_01660 [Anaerolineae bacterium]|nr:hypothetical protein [Anaerolineae bacterium]